MCTPRRVSSPDVRKRLAGAGVLFALTLALAVGLVAQANKLMALSGLSETAPEVFRARFDTSKGSFVIEVHRAWAPIGADRFYNLVKNGFYDGTRFFRVRPGFMAQFGLNGNPEIQSA